MAIKAFNSSGSSNSTLIVQAMDFAINNGAEIINMSLAMSSYDSALAAKVEEAEAANVLIVAAADNTTPGKNIDANGKIYPCAYTGSNVLCVTALDQAYVLATFANYGATSVDVGGPGTNIYSTYFSGNDKYRVMNGTSMATPHVTGLAALIMSYHRNTAGDFAMTGIHARDAIMRGGVAVSALSSKTSTGKAIDGVGALSQISTPYGVTGTVQ